jgi:hypothetical protein
VIALLVLAMCAVVAVVIAARDNGRAEAARFRRVQDDFDRMERNQRDARNRNR